MRKTLDHALDDFLGTVWVGGDFVADLENSAPILGRRLLVSRLGCVDVSGLLWCAQKLLLTDDIVIRRGGRRTEHSAGWLVAYVLASRCRSHK